MSQPLTRRRYRATAVLVLLVVISALVTTSLGAYLETTLFLDPVTNLRWRLGLNPKPSPELRLILMEDRSLARMQRIPSADDWLALVERLKQLGFERILFLGLQVPSAIAGAAPTSRPSLVQGIVDARDAANLRAVATSTLPKSLLLAAPGAATSFAGSDHVVGIAPGSAAHVGALGLINLPSANAMPAAVAVGGDALIPNIGLWAARSLAWSAENGLEADGRRVPLSYDGTLLVNYLDYRDLIANAVAAYVFFGAPGEAAPELAPAVRDKLAGGRVAIIAPDAWTGTRFVVTALGQVPTFVAPASVASSVLTGRFIVAPWSPAALLVPFGLLVGALAAFRRSWRCVATLGAVSIATAAVGIAVFLAMEIVVPLAGLVIIGVAATAFVAVAAALDTFREKILYQADLELGKTVQAHLLPKDMDGQFAGWRYRVTSRPYGAMSGDWYLMHKSPRSEAFALLAIGDVVGKGASAALCTAVIAAVWASLSKQWRSGAFDLALAVETLNETLWTLFSGSQNSTLSLALLTPEEIQLTALGAPAWVVVTPKLELVRPKVAASNPIGMLKALEPPKFVRLAAKDVKGTVVAAYTDGVLDGAKARRKLQMELADSGSRLPATAESAFAHVEAIMRHAGEGATQPDDATIAMIFRDA